MAVGFSLQTLAGQAEVLGGFVAAILITYAVAAHEDRRGALVGASLVTAGIVFSALYDPANRSFADTFANLFLFAVVWTLGRAVRSRQRRADMAELTAREREEQARTAVRDERARIARELHDVVAHCVSVMVLHAGAARRVLHDDPERVAELLLLVEETGRQALAEMQRLLGILRENGARAALTPQPGLDALSALAEQMRRSRLPVELRVEGQPRLLPAGVGLAAYRIVQEALTNALKHAGPATASVRIAYRPEQIELEVVDDGRGAGDGRGTGHGLVGMRERAALYGGEIEAAPLEKRGFRVRARLPLGLGSRVIEVLIADDEPVVRGGLRMIVEAESDMTVSGDAGAGREAVERSRLLRPDVVLMDIRMPGIDGLEATRRLRSADRDGPRVLVLTTFDLDEYVYEALRAGASGFLLKSASPERIVDAIRTVFTGGALLAPEVTRRLIEECVRHPRPPGGRPPEIEELTERELEVLKLIARGQSNAEIATGLFVSEGTVKTHVNHILRKLALRDRVQAVVFAYESGLVRPGGA